MLCQEKKKFKTRNGAEKALMLIWKQAVNQGTKRNVLPCRSYLCPVCGKWHLTSKAIKRKD